MYVDCRTTGYCLEPMDKASGQLASVEGSSLASVDETTGLVTLQGLPITGQEGEKPTVDSVFNTQTTVRAVSLTLSSLVPSTIPADTIQTPTAVEVKLTFSVKKSGDTVFSPVTEINGQPKVCT